MHVLPSIPQHRKKTMQLLGVTHRLQSLMLSENISPDELVACAKAVRLSYESVTMAESELQGEKLSR